MKCSAPYRMKRDERTMTDAIGCLTSGLRFCNSALVLGPVLVIENRFSESEVFGSHFQQFIVCQEFQTLFETHLFRWNETQGFFAAGGSHICKILLFADVYVDISRFRSNADYHSLIDWNSGSDEERTAVLGVEETVCVRLARLESHRLPVDLLATSPRKGS